MSDHQELFNEPGTTGLDGVVVRNLMPDDLEAVVRIDARLTGESRRAFFAKKLDEVRWDTGLAISLAAELDDTFAGFLLGRLYYGEFGLPEATAIIDTIGVEPALKGRQVGRALLHQLRTNLRALGIESIRTEVDWTQLDLLGFLQREGFTPAPSVCLESRLG